MTPPWKFSPEYYARSLAVLDTALRELDAYKPWRCFDPGPDYHIDARYSAMPALTKKHIREHFPEGFVPPGRDIKLGLETGEIEFVSTSGTIDISVTNIWNQKWWDASERASWKLNAHADRLGTGTQLEAILGNARSVGFISDDVDLPKEKRRVARFLYLNEKTDPLLWSARLMDRMVRELGIFQPAVLEANPSLLARLCRYIAASKKSVFQPGFIVLTFEYPTNFHYRQIRRVFEAPVLSSYGSTETGYVFMQCEEGKFHQNSEFCRVDFQPLKSEQGGPYLGRILTTTFNNPWYYMVHFDVGDLARIDETGECSCGRNSGLILTAIEGRPSNATLTCAGRLVTPRELDDAVSVLKGVDEYRLDQVSADTYELQLASERFDKGRLSEEATEVLKELYGKETSILVSYRDAFSPESSGKYRISRADFPIEIENYLDEGHDRTGTAPR